MNHVGLVGRITKDPILKQLTEGRIHVSFILAINRNFRNSEGEVEADFVLCSVWGRLAERVAKYCGKGSLVGVNGRLQTRSYTNRDNVKVYSTEVVVDDVRFYVLKIPGKDQETQELPSDISRTSQIAESIAGFETIPNEDPRMMEMFELPKVEEGLPIR
nr:single-stranded DNA-binding protein [Lysinibacillus timonensis]